MLGAQSKVETELIAMQRCENEKSAFNKDRSTVRVQSPSRIKECPEQNITPRSGRDVRSWSKPGEAGVKELQENHLTNSGVD